MSSDKKWKDALLSSGLPLEATVAACLERHGAHVFGEYEFPTVNLDGEQMLRSVDLHAYWDLPAVDLNVAVECKYRRDGVCWFFMPPKLANSPLNNRRFAMRPPAGARRACRAGVSGSDSEAARCG